MNYREKVLAFLDCVWQEDAEIEFIKLLDENRDHILTASDSVIKDYLRRLWKENEAQVVPSVSECFVYEFELLIK